MTGRTFFLPEDMQNTANLKPSGHMGSFSRSYDLTKLAPYAPLLVPLGLAFAKWATTPEREPEPERDYVTIPELRGKLVGLEERAEKVLEAREQSLITQLEERVKERINNK